MLLSKRSLYGIRAALFMAARPDRRYVSVKEISSTLGISEHYLPKVLQDLTRVGITASSRGPHGGIALARSPDQISLGDIIHAVDGLPTPSDCPFSDSSCTEGDPCTFCARWKDVCGLLEDLLDETTVAQVGECTSLQHLHGLGPDSVHTKTTTPIDNESDLNAT